MVYRLRIRNEAKADLAAAVDYYDGIEASLTPRLLDNFQKCVRRLTVFPLAGPLVYQDFRRVVLTSFPYNVFYRVVGSEVFVVAVIHQRRDPDHSRRTVLGR